MALRRWVVPCLLPYMTGFYVAAGFTFQQILFVSADLQSAAPASVLAGLQSAMLCVTAFLQSADCRRGRSSAPGSKNHRTALYCRQADSAAAALYCFKDSAPGGREESPLRSSPQRVSGAQAADSASTCKSTPCVPQRHFPVPD